MMMKYVKIKISKYVDASYAISLWNVNCKLSTQKIWVEINSTSRSTQAHDELTRAWSKFIDF